jgi:hypothetical protein
MARSPRHCRRARFRKHPRLDHREFRRAAVTDLSGHVRSGDRQLANGPDVAGSNVTRSCRASARSILAGAAGADVISSCTGSAKGKSLKSAISSMTRWTYSVTCHFNGRGQPIARRADFSDLSAGAKRVKADFPATAGYAGACHRAALCADSLGQPALAPMNSREEASIWRADLCLCDLSKHHESIARGATAPWPRLGLRERRNDRPGCRQAGTKGSSCR